MKLIIDIPEEEYERIIKTAQTRIYTTSDLFELIDMLKNGTPFDSVKADVINIADGRQSIKVRSVLRILDRIGKESEGKE